jgi:hypothetical protein
VVAPLPEEAEIPEDGESPDGEDVPVAGDPADEGEPPRFRCGSAAETLANLAPITAAAAAETRPACQVIFLTRRRPTSRARAAFECWVRVTGIRVTGRTPL